MADEPKKKKSPFIFVDVKCPICGEKSKNRKIKAKTYVVAEMDTDNRPIKVTWRDKTFDGTNPTLYTVWLCTNCFFVETEDVWRTPDPKKFQKAIITNKMEDDKEEETSVYKLLGEGIDWEADHVSYSDAIRGLALGIFMQEGIPPSLRDQEKVAVWYLRVTWLFRDLKDRKEKDIDEGDVERLTELAPKVQAAWPESPLSEMVAIAKAAENFESVIGNMGDADVKKELNYYVLLANIKRTMGKLDASYDMMTDAIQLAMKRMSAKAAAASAARDKNPGAAESLENEVAWLEKNVDSIKDARETIAAEIVESELPKAAMALKKKHPSTEGKLHSLLDRASITRATQDRIDGVLEELVAERTVDLEAEFEARREDMADQAPSLAKKIWIILFGSKKKEEEKPPEETGEDVEIEGETEELEGPVEASAEAGAEAEAEAAVEESAGGEGAAPEEVPAGGEAAEGAPEAEDTAEGEAAAESEAAPESEAAAEGGAAPEGGSSVETEEAPKAETPS